MERDIIDEAGKWDMPRVPPLGVMPTSIHKEQRLEDIRQAMNRFNQFHKYKKLCPQEWLDEKHELEEWLRNRKKKEDKIEVLNFTEIKMLGNGNDEYHYYTAVVKNPIPKEKYAALKKAIEFVLNSGYDDLVVTPQDILEKHFKQSIGK